MMERIYCNMCGKEIEDEKYIALERGEESIYICTSCVNKMHNIVEEKEKAEIFDKKVDLYKEAFMSVESAFTSFIKEYAETEGLKEVDLNTANKALSIYGKNLVNARPSQCEGKRPVMDSIVHTALNYIELAFQLIFNGEDSHIDLVSVPTFISLFQKRFYEDLESYISFHLSFSGALNDALKDILPEGAVIKAIPVCTYCIK